MKYAERTIVDPANYKCGDCAFFRIHSCYENKCVELGAKHTDAPCKNFMINLAPWSADERVTILNALHMLQRAKITSRDLEALIASSHNLPANRALGVRVWVNYTLPTHKKSHLLATIIGRSRGKYLLVTETGGVLHITDDMIKDYDTIDPAKDVSLSAVIVMDGEKDKSKKSTPSVKEQPITNMRLRGAKDKEDKVETAKPNSKQKPKPQPKSNVRVNSSRKFRSKSRSK